MTTARTLPGGALKTVNEDDLFPALQGHPLHNLKELGKTEVAHLPSPQGLHPGQVQVFKDEEVVAITQIVCQLEVKITAFVGNANVPPREVALTFLLVWMVPRVRHPGWAVATGLLLAGVSGNLFDRLTREPGAFHGHVIDFLQVPWFAVFNVADIWITFAAITVIWLTMITQVNLAGERVERPSRPAGRSGS